PASKGHEEVVGGVDESGAVRTIEAKLDGYFCHRLPQRPSPARSRPRCTGKTSRRYHSLAMASVVGRVPSRAAAFAAWMLVASSVFPSSARSAPRARTAVGAIAPQAMRPRLIRPPALGR